MIGSSVDEHQCDLDGYREDVQLTVIDIDESECEILVAVQKKAKVRRHD